MFVIERNGVGGLYISARVRILSGIKVAGYE